MARIHLAVINDLVSDNRVHKVCKTLEGMGFWVHLTGRKLPKSPMLNKRTYSTHRMRLLFKKGPLFYAEYNFWLFFHLMINKYDVIVANDLDTLPASYLAAKLKKKPLVYDSHEYFTEVPELIDRPKIKRFWERIEGKIVPKVDSAYTVCYSIANTYSKKYNIPFDVVRNLPEQYTVEEIPEAYRISGNGEKIIIYQGALNVGRGLEQVITAMQFIDAHLYIAGDGDIREQLKALTIDLNLKYKVSFLGRIALEKLRFYTAQADLGISAEEDLGLNYRYALPNKIFDYIQSGVPVLCSPLPEMKNIINQYQIGQCIESKEPEALSKQISDMLFNETKRAEYINNLSIAAKELNWNQEKKVLESIFQVFLYH